MYRDPSSEISYDEKLSLDVILILFTLSKQTKTVIYRNRTTTFEITILIYHKIYFSAFYIYMTNNIIIKTNVALCKQPVRY